MLLQVFTFISIKKLIQVKVIYCFIFFCRVDNKNKNMDKNEKNVEGFSALNQIMGYASGDSDESDNDVSTFNNFIN